MRDLGPELQGLLSLHARALTHQPVDEDGHRGHILADRNATSSASCSHQIRTGQANLTGPWQHTTFGQIRPDTTSPI